jgi:uncharacterized membrane protein YkvA (DUF1232 family)
MRFPWSKKKSAEAPPAGAAARPGATLEPEAPAPPPPPIRPEDYVGADETRNEQVVREGFAAKAKRYLRKLPIAEDVVALYFCLLDGRTPLWAKGVAAAALAYFILPLDAVPDFLPLIGLGDDLSVLSAALAAVAVHITPEHRAKARAWLSDLERAEC